MSQRSPVASGPREIEIVFIHRERIIGKEPAPSFEIRYRAFFTVVQGKRPKVLITIAEATEIDMASVV